MVMIPLQEVKHQFEPFTVQLFIFAFVVLPQLIEQFMITFSCTNLKAENETDEASKVEGMYFNYFDSSIKCSREIYVSTDFYAGLLFVIIWLGIAPSYLLLKLHREFVIETFGMIAKLLILVSVKYISRLNQTFSKFIGTSIIAAQFLIFL